MFDGRLFKHAHSLALASDIRPLQPCSDNGVLWIATSEAQSGYVVGQHTNFQPEEVTERFEIHDAYTVGTRFIAPQPLRLVETPQPETNGLLARVDATYRKILSRTNMEIRSQIKRKSTTQQKGVSSDPNTQRMLITCT